MKNNHILLKESIDALKLFRLEMHDVMDSGELVELDKIITNLETCRDNKSATQLLDILGKVITLVPAVAKLLQLL